MLTNESILETLKVQPLTEEEKQSKHILKRLSGPIASCKEGTRNGRRYSKELWEKALNDDIFKEKVATKSLFLELGHPADRDETDMSCVCAVIPEMPKIVNDELYAVVDVIDSPNGKLLDTLIDYGFVPGISSRGTGDLIDDEVDPETFFLETWDIVQTPALKKARLSVTESLTNKTNLKKALCESLENADDKDKKVMEEALDNLNIKLDEDKEEDVAVVDVADVDIPDTLVDDVKSDEEESEAEMSYEDKIKQLFALTYKGEGEPKDEEVEAFVQAFLSIFPEECDNPDDCADKDSDEDKVSTDDEEAIDDGADLEIVDSLKEALKDKTNLLAKIKSLQEQLAVSDAKVMSLQENLTKNESTIVRLTALAKESRKLSGHVSSLTESIKEKDNEIKTLNEKLSKSDVTDEKDSKIKELNESLTSLKESHAKEIDDLKESSSKQLSESTKLVESLKDKVTKSMKVAEGFKHLANNTMNKYIQLRAKNLAVKVDDIVSRLPADYTVDDVDSICESLNTYAYQASKLPFDVNDKVSVKLHESKVKRVVSTNDDDYVDEDILRLVDSI